MIRFLTLTFTATVWLSLSSATPYDQHLHPCQTIPDLDTSTCQGLCSKCDTKPIKRNPSNTNSPINIALNRPSYMIDSWQCTHSQGEDRCYCPTKGSIHDLNEPCGGNNGLENGSILSTNCLDSKPFDCFHTSHREPSWWYVDLEKPVTTKEVSMYPRAFAISNSVNHLRLCDIMIIVDASLCRTTHSSAYISATYTSRNPILYRYYCEEPRRGRFVRFQKLPSACELVLTFCEINVYACPSGYTSEDKTCTACDTSCVRCDRNGGGCPNYPCDSHYGCFGPESAENRTTDVAMMKSVLGYSQFTDHPYEYLVDGVTEPRDFRCYKSEYATESKHFVRVDLVKLYQIIKAKVVTCTNSENSYVGFEVRTVARKITQQESDSKVKQLDGDELCWRKQTALGAEYEQKCDGCVGNLDDCPRAIYVTFFPSTPTSYLNLCEVMAYGFPIKELSLGSVCGTCKLELCEKGNECINGTCRSPIGGPCSSDAQCPTEGLCEGQMCKLPLNAPCSGSRTIHCGSGMGCMQSVCKLLLGMGPCTNDSDCALDTLTCDYTKICRVRLNVQCGRDSECVAGAQCLHLACECNPDHAIPSVILNTCVPKVLGKPCGDNNDCSNSSNAICNRTCQCDSSFTMDDRDFSCKVASGNPCDPTNSACSTGTTCQDPGNGLHVCLVGLGGQCAPSKETQQCIPGSVCDKTEELCLKEIGQSCNPPGQCQSGGVCQKGACHITLGVKCNDSQWCENGTDCSVPATSIDFKKKCLILVGGACEKDDHCPNGTLCNEHSYKDKTCRVDILGACEPGKDQCLQYASCDTSRRCVWKIGGSCESDNYCGSNALCDANICRYKIGEDCSETPTFCQLRSRCNNETKRCTCVDFATQNADCTVVMSLVSTTCQPGGVNDSRPESCADAGKAKCDKTKQQCVCLDGYGPDQNLVCKPNAGFPCYSVNENFTKAEWDHRCAAGAVCENRQCLLNVGEPCVNKFERLYCRSGSACGTDGKCRLTIGSKCDGDLSEMCIHGLVCDLFGKCQQPTGSDCVYNGSCVSGAKCLNDGKGKFSCQCDQEISEPAQVKGRCNINQGKTGGACLSGSTCEDTNAICSPALAVCECKDGFEISEDDLVCLIAEGFPCKDPGDCSRGKECDEKLHVCKRALGSLCSVIERDDTSCANGAVCDESSCKIDEGGACGSEDRSPHCKVGTMCDLIGRCKRGVGYFCSSTEQCGAGMTCKQKQCRCNTAVTYSFSFWCGPREGKVGSPCSPSFPCKAPGSFCDEKTGACQCEGLVVPRDLSCDVAGSAPEENSQIPWFLQLFIYLLLMILLLLLILAMVYRIQGSKKKDILQKEMAERRQKLNELNLSVESLELSQSEHSEEMDDMGSEVDSVPTVPSKMQTIAPDSENPILKSDSVDFQPLELKGKPSDSFSSDEDEDEHENTS